MVKVFRPAQLAPAAQLVRGYAAPPNTQRHPSEIMSCISTHVLDDTHLKGLLQPDVWSEFIDLRTKGKPMTKDSKNAMARAVREW